MADLQQLAESAHVQQKSPMSFWMTAALGGCAGMLVDSVLFPLDTIKTRLQQRRGTGAAHQAPTPFQARSFYRGLLSNMAGSFPAAATFWSVYEAAKSASSHLAAPDDDLQQGARHAACAAAADVAVTVVRNPFEVRVDLFLHPAGGMRMSCQPN
jgi:solute carrier family 25 (mitochondrial S-adenosylmethionine transporter), member 26